MDERIVDAHLEGAAPAFAARDHRLGTVGLDALLQLAALRLEVALATVGQTEREKKRVYIHRQLFKSPQILPVFDVDRWTTAGHGSAGENEKTTTPRTTDGSRLFSRGWWVVGGGSGSPRYR